MRQDEENYQAKVDPRLWRKLLGYTLRYRGRVALLFVLVLVVAGVDTALPLVSKGVIDTLERGGGIDELMEFAWVYALMVFLLAGGVFGFIYVGGWLRSRVAADIREAGFANLQRLSFAYFDKRPVGWLMARMTSDCDRLSRIMSWGLIDVVWGIAVMIGLAGVMFVLDVRLACIALAVLPALAIVSKLFQRRILQSSRTVRKTNSKITASYNEHITGIRTSKVFVRERAQLDGFRELTDEMYGASVKNLLQSALYTPLVMALASVATGFVLATGGFEVARGGLSIGTLIVFLAYSRQFFEPVTELSRIYAELQMAHASAERILGLIEAKPEICDSVDLRYRLRFADRRPVEAGMAPDGFPDSVGHIEFQDVAFGYRSDVSVLRNFNLRVEPGRTIALVGSTGGGKSTIVNLLCRFYEPTSGRISIGGVDYRDRSLAWLQSKLGIVLQTPHLFSGTVADNLRYGKLDATDEELEEAARLVGAHELITRMEDGYATEVGEGGSRLSTGEKQLLSFARAVLADPQILVMDEATSSIDTETEARIQQGVGRLLRGRTSFVIAHRLSTIRSADRILVIEAGEIVESGSHPELMALRGRYFELNTRERADESGRDERLWKAPNEPVPRPT